MKVVDNKGMKTVLLVEGYITDIQNDYDLFIPDEIRNLCVIYFDTRSPKIWLQYHSHRGDYSQWSENRHPKRMLEKNGQGYFSQLNKEFAYLEQDWIIFEYVEKHTIYKPTKFKLVNDVLFYNRRAIKTMSIFIGDVNKNLWFQFEPNTINIKDTDKPQQFSICGINDKIIRENKLTFIKIKFLDNYGETDRVMPRFGCIYFALYGYKC